MSLSVCMYVRCNDPVIAQRPWDAVSRCRLDRERQRPPKSLAGSYKLCLASWTSCVYDAMRFLSWSRIADDAGIQRNIENDFGSRAKLASLLDGGIEMVQSTRTHVMALYGTEKPLGTGIRVVAEGNSNYCLSHSKRVVKCF